MIDVNRAQCVALARRHMREKMQQYDGVDAPRERHRDSLAAQVRIRQDARDRKCQGALALAGLSCAPRGP